jgi:hypothetical protein
MSGNAIFLIKDGDEIIRLDPASYATENEFQAVLARCPDLIAGDQIDPENPRRWLLIDRELGIPDQEEGSDRWSIDHLFLDQDAIPTLVEVKRQQDTRLRREVVGQMLDYAANSASYWPGDRMRSRFYESCGQEGKDAASALAAFLGEESDPEAFWATANENLKDGRVRLLFVADSIPKELRRVVEFLNERMSPTEVLAVEVARYEGGGIATHIPRVIGQTVEAQLGKGTRPRQGARRKWDEASFFADAKERLQPEVLSGVTQLYRFLAANSEIRWGTGAAAGSASPLFGEFQRTAPFSLYSNGNILLKLSWLDRPEEIEFGKTYAARLLDAGIPADTAPGSDRTLEPADWLPRLDAIIDSTRGILDWLNDHS